VCVVARPVKASVSTESCLVSKAECNLHLMSSVVRIWSEPFAVEKATSQFKDAHVI
jgi:hypothetical protein